MIGIFFFVSHLHSYCLHYVMHRLINLNNKNKTQTFRPKKKFEPGTLRYSLHKQAIASLNSGINLREVVKLPQGKFFFKLMIMTYTHTQKMIVWFVKRFDFASLTNILNGKNDNMNQFFFFFDD